MAVARAPQALLVALAGLLGAACFAGQTTRLPAEGRLQVAVVVITGIACAAWLYGGGIRLAASPLAWTGVGLLAAFAAWTGASITWSVAPDLSWAELNRGVAYLLVLVCGIALGASLPRARERWATAIALLSATIGLYAVAGKTIPGVDLFGLVNLDHAGGTPRLRAPLEYWNALALMCVFGIPAMLRFAADPDGRTWRRLLSLAGVYLLVVVIGMTYSRGGVLAGTAALATYTLFTTHRLRTLTLFALAATFATLPLTLALTSPELTGNAVPIAQREGPARTVLVALLIGAAIVAALGLLMIRLERRRVLTPLRGRRLGRVLGIGFAGLLALGIVSSVASGALEATIDSFTTDAAPQVSVIDPNRLISTTSGNRWVWWKEAAGAWSDEPMIGWGAGSFPVTHKLYRRNTLTVRQPHNVALQFLAETGLVGALLGFGGLLALLAAGLARTRETPWAIEGAGPARPATAALLAVGVAWLVHSFYDWDWDLPGVTLTMFVTLGVLVARRPLTPPVAGGPGLRGLGFAGVVAALVLVTVSAYLPAIAAGRNAAALDTVGADSVSDEALVDAAGDAELAARLNPLSIEPLLTGSAIAERRGRADEARALLVRAAARQPENADPWFSLVRLDFQRLDRAAIRAESQRALELDPMNAGAFLIARAAQSNSALPGESATATGSPLPTQVPITDPLAGLNPPAPAPAVPTPFATASPPSG